MKFEEQLQEFAKRFDQIKNIRTEEATKTSFILPFFQLLGYDIFNPTEFVPEFSADVGIKRGEKVDYAIMRDGNPIILIEAKHINEKLKKHTSQLYRYFSVTPAKFAILTNGKVYKFYSDLDEPNKMDDEPFLEIDLTSIKPQQAQELFKFSKSVFDVDSILDVASELRYIDEFKYIMKTEFEEPSDDLVRFFLKDIYTGVKTKNVVEKYRPVLLKAMHGFINDYVGERLSVAFDPPTKPDPQPALPPARIFDWLSEDQTEALEAAGYSVETLDHGQNILRDSEIVAKVYYYKRKKQLFVRSPKGLFFARYILDRISPEKIAELIGV